MFGLGINCNYGFIAMLKFIVNSKTISSTSVIGNALVRNLG